MTLQEENQKLRELLTTIRVAINLDDTEYGLSKQEKRRMVDEINAALTQGAEPCGGCGNADESKRCIGCGHRFEKPVAMCETMQRPKAECGCPDCGSSLIDWPKVSAHRENLDK